MATIKDDYLVQCPYYKTHASQLIKCEGWEEGMGHYTTFATRKQLIDYKERFCRRDTYHRCPWANLLNQKWGYEV